MAKTYKVGDWVLQYPFGMPEAARWVQVTARVPNIKNGRNGFDGLLIGGVSVWGYDSEVMEVKASQ